MNPGSFQTNVYDLPRMSSHHSNLKQLKSWKYHNWKLFFYESRQIVIAIWSSVTSTLFAETARYNSKNFAELTISIYILAFSLLGPCVSQLLTSNKTNQNL